MSCPDLAGTGVPVASILIVASVLLAFGVLLVLASRAGRNHSGNAVVLSIVLGGALAASLAGWSSARAAPVSCRPDSGVGTNAFVTISQTSIITGMAPGVPPAAIAGVVANHGLHDAYVDAITVSITSVTKASAAAAGHCSAEDYVLAHATMPVGVLLAPGASANFKGASIAFQNRSINQDACKAATVTLHYVTSS
jgi:hypothetical protein